MTDVVQHVLRTGLVDDAGIRHASVEVRRLASPTSRTRRSTLSAIMVTAGIEPGTGDMTTIWTLINRGCLPEGFEHARVRCRATLHTFLARLEGTK